MGRFFLVDHPADIAVKIEAGDLYELFSTAFDALKFILLGEIKFEQTEVRKLELYGIDSEELLVNFLTELNFLISDKKYLVCAINNFKIAKFNDELVLSCELSGTVDAQDNFEIKEEIKAVTYHKLGIVNTEKGFSTLIIFDV